MMQNPQAVSVGAKLGRRLNLKLILPAASQSPDPVAFCGGLIAAIAGGLGGALGTQTAAELLRIALARLDGMPHLELPPGVRLQLAAAANEEPPIAGGIDARQALIALGKYAAGYRPGQDGWTELDQAALAAANGISTELELREHEPTRP